MSSQITSLKNQQKEALELLPLELWGAIAQRCDDTALKDLSLIAKIPRIEALKEYHRRVKSSAMEKLCEKVVNIDQGSHPIQKALLNILKKAFQNENVQAEAITAYNQWILNTIRDDLSEKNEQIINAINSKPTTKKNFRSAYDALEQDVIKKAFDKMFLANTSPIEARKVALEEAITLRSMEVASAILSANLFDSTSLGRFLILATENNLPEVVQLLLETSIISEDDRSEAALEATTHGYSSVLKIILDHGTIDPDFLEESKRVALNNDLVECLAILVLKQA